MFLVLSLGFFPFCLLVLFNSNGFVFVSFYLLLSIKKPVHFLIRGRKGVDLDGKEVGETGRRRGGEIIFMIYYVRKESLFHEKKIEKKKYPPKVTNASFVNSISASGVPHTCPAPCCMLKMQWRPRQILPHPLVT